MLKPTSAIMGQGLGDEVALLLMVDFQEELMVLLWVILLPKLM